MKRNLIHHTQIPMTKEPVGKTTLLNGVRTKLHCIGRDGFSIICDQKRLIELLPNPATVSPKSAVRFTCEFNLPGYDKTLITPCEAIYARRLSRDSFQMSLKFTVLTEEQTAIIDAFVEEHLNGNTSSKAPATSQFKQSSHAHTVKVLNFAA